MSMNPKKMNEKILQKALHLFLQKGYDGTSTNDICWASRITKPTLYYYFPSKKHILYATHMENIMNVLHPYLDKCNALEDPLERLNVMLKDYAIMICSHPELRFLLHETLNIKDEPAKEIKKEWKRHYLLLRDTIAELQRSGNIRSGLKPSGAALLLLGMVTWMTYWFDHKRKNSIDEIVGLVLDMALHALGLQENTTAVGSKKVRSRAKK
jgi:AcrR family transcriptional regulator